MREMLGSVFGGVLCLWFVICGMECFQDVRYVLGCTLPKVSCRRPELLTKMMSGMTALGCVNRKGTEPAFLPSVVLSTWRSRAYCGQVVR